MTSLAKQELAGLTESQKKFHTTSGLDDSIRSLFHYSKEKTTWSSKTIAPVETTKDSLATSFKFDTSYDFLLSSTLRITIPQISVKNEHTGKVQICWTPNLGTNVTPKIDFVMVDNDKKFSLDTFSLDHYFQFMDKRPERIIQKSLGNIKQLIDWSEKLPREIINIPQPFFYSQDSCLAFPLSEFPSGSIKQRYTFRRKITELLRMRKMTTEGTWDEVAVDLACLDLAKKTKIPTPELRAEYRFCSDEERKNRKCKSEHVYNVRDIFICDAETASVAGGKSSVVLECDLPCSFFTWSLENMSVKGNNFSNYTTNKGDSREGSNPCVKNSFYYGTLEKFNDLPHDHFSFTEPSNHAPSIPFLPGYNCYSNAHKMDNLDTDSVIIYKPLGAKLNVETSGEEKDVKYLLKARLFVIRELKITTGEHVEVEIS